MMTRRGVLAASLAALVTPLPMNAALPDGTWISVAESLPPFGQQVEIQGKTRNTRAIGLRMYGRDGVSLQWFTLVHFIVSDEFGRLVSYSVSAVDPPGVVTHWRPLRNVAK